MKPQPQQLPHVCIRSHSCVKGEHGAKKDSELLGAVKQVFVASFASISDSRCVYVHVCVRERVIGDTLERDGERGGIHLKMFIAIPCFFRQVYLTALTGAATLPRTPVQ